MPNPTGMPEGTVLRGNGVSFWARNEEMQTPAREKGAKPARNAAGNGSAREPFSYDLNQILYDYRVEVRN